MKKTIRSARMLTLCLALLMMALPTLAMGDAAHTLEVRHVSSATGEVVLPAQTQAVAPGTYVSYTPGNPSGLVATHAAIQVEGGMTIASVSAGGGIIMPGANVSVTIYYGYSLSEGADAVAVKPAKASSRGSYTIEDSAVPLAGGDVTVIGGGDSAPTEMASSGNTAVVANPANSNEPDDNNADVNTSATTGVRWWRVSFLDGTGEEMYWINIEEGKTAAWPWDEPPYREGKTFAYWWRVNDFDEEGHEVPYDFDLPITEDTPILARYYTEDGEVLLDDIPMDSYYSILEDRSEFNENDLETYSSILTDHSEPPVYTAEDFGSILNDRSDDPLYNVEDYASILTTHEDEEVPPADEDAAPQDNSFASSILTAHEEEEAPANEAIDDTAEETEDTAEEADDTTTEEEPQPSILVTNEEEAQPVEEAEETPADETAQADDTAEDEGGEEMEGFFTVTFLNADNSVLDTLSLPEGEIAVWSQSGPVSPDEYLFAYWADANAYLEAAYDLATPVTGDVTLIARYMDENGAVILPDAVSLDDPTAEINAQQAAASILLDSTADVVPAPVVTLTFDIGEEALHVGSEITIYAHISGILPETEYTIQWEQNRGEGFEAIDGETGLAYTFIANEENVMYEYRAMVTVTNP